MPQTHKYDTNVAEERPRVGVYSLAGDEIGTYSKLQRK